MRQKEKMNLSMILIKKLNESGVENAPLFFKICIFTLVKKYATIKSY